MTSEEFAAATGIDAYLPFLKRLVTAERPYRYTYMPSSEYRTLADPVERSRIYWYEILERAHFGAIASLARAEAWIRAMDAAATSENFLAFAASFRGLIEATADARFALGDVPMELATTFRLAHDAVSGKAKLMALAPDLENDLIHFSHARKSKRNESSPETHAAKAMREYLQALQGAPTGPLFTCYEELCNITHPAAHSVLYLVEKATDGSLVFSPRADERAIVDLCARAGTVVTFCVSESLFCPTIILRIINRFGLRALQTPAADAVPLDEVPLWRDVVTQLAVSNADSPV
jgi:hypothetical protein